MSEVVVEKRGLGRFWRRDGKDELPGDVECPICLMMLYRPVLHGCGNGFCMDCAERATVNADRCPICRRESMMREIVVWTEMEKRLMAEFPSEYARRKREVEKCRRESMMREIVVWTEMEKRLMAEFPSEYARRKREVEKSSSRSWGKEKLKNFLSSVNNIDGQLVLAQFADMGPAGHLV